MTIEAFNLWFLRETLENLSTLTIFYVSFCVTLTFQKISYTTLYCTVVSMSFKAKDIKVFLPYLPSPNYFFQEMPVWYSFWPFSGTRNALMIYGNFRICLWMTNVWQPPSSLLPQLMTFSHATGFSSCLRSSSFFWGGKSHFANNWQPFL